MRRTPTTGVLEAGRLMPISAPDVLLATGKRQLDSTAWTSESWQFVKQLAPFLRS
jgi:hypothetical protein